MDANTQAVAVALLTDAGWFNNTPDGSDELHFAGVFDNFDTMFAVKLMTDENGGWYFNRNGGPWHFVNTQLLAAIVADPFAVYESMTNGTETDMAFAGFGWGKATRQYDNISAFYSKYIYQSGVMFTVKLEQYGGEDQWFFACNGVWFIVKADELVLIACHPLRCWRMLNDGQVAAHAGDLAAAVAADTLEWPEWA